MIHIMFAHSIIIVLLCYLSIITIVYTTKPSRVPCNTFFSNETISHSLQHIFDIKNIHILLITLQRFRDHDVSYITVHMLYQLLWARGRPPRAPPPIYIIYINNIIMIHIMFAHVIIIVLFIIFIVLFINYNNCIHNETISRSPQHIF